MSQPVMPSHHATAATVGFERRRGVFAVAQWLLFLLATLALLYAVYGKVNMLFLRAESGGYEATVGNGWKAIRAQWYTDLITSHAGHYTPLFFWSELGWTVLFRTRAAYWRLRQLTLLALLSLALCSFFSQAAQRNSRGVARWALAVGLSAPLVLSPMVINLVAWPMESCLFMWAICTVLSLLWLGKAADGAADGPVSPRALGVSLACGYGSMHFLGLGLVTMAGWFAAYAVLFLVAWRQRVPRPQLRTLVWLGGIGALLTAGHTVLMIVLVPKPLPGQVSLAPPPAVWPFAGETLGYTMHLLVDCARSLWSPNALLSPNNNLLTPEWPYGLATLLLLAAGAACGWRYYCARPSLAALRGLCWHVFSLTGFLIYILMVAARVYQHNGDWLIYLLADRYVWPPAIVLLGSVAAVVMCVRVQDRWLASAFGVLVLGGTVAGNLVYQRQVVPTAWPWTTLSHESAWQQMVSMACELQRAGLPLPNFPLGKLTLEYDDADLHKYEGLLRQSAKLAPDADFKWVSAREITPALWSNLLRASPTLDLLSEGTVFPDAETAILADDAIAARNQGRPTPFLPLTHPAVLAAAVLDHVKDHPNLGVEIMVRSTAKKSLWIDPPTTITFRDLSLGQHPAFVSGVTIHPSIYPDRGADGAVFQVDVRVGGQTERLAAEYINPMANPAQRRWMPLRVDLARFAGQRVDLILSNSPGPAGNDYGDWCLWGDPEVVEE